MMVSGWNMATLMTGRQLYMYHHLLIQFTAHPFHPLGSGAHGPECVSIEVPILAAGIPTVLHPYVV